MDANTKDVLVALVTVAGTVASAVFASRAKGHARIAMVAKDAAVAASLKPPRMPTGVGSINPGIRFIDLEDEDDGPADTPRDPSMKRWKG